MKKKDLLHNVDKKISRITFCDCIYTPITTRKDSILESRPCGSHLKYFLLLC